MKTGEQGPTGFGPTSYTGAQALEPGQKGGRRKWDNPETVTEKAVPPVPPALQRHLAARP
jgi:hypothetical protein